MEYQEITPTDRERLATWLAADTWPYHVNTSPTYEDALKRFDDGHFNGPEVRSFWMVLDGEAIGLLMLQDLEDESPMLDLRLKTAFRGRGLGAQAVQWMTKTIFENYPEATRIEGQTREDNLAMRRTFRKLGYAKEAHYRSAWPTPTGPVAAIGYGILRSDWAQGTVTPVNWDDE
jgi:RimJ/RimL family protein N-acetyltransferase